MKRLKELQDEFQRGILAEDDAILAEVNDSAKEDRKVLFGVYRHAYVARLAEIVGQGYEQVHAYIGDQAFARLVKAYIAAHPSDQRNARWFSRHLPAFMAKLAAYVQHPEVAALAALEEALADAFDEPDCKALRSRRWPRLSRRRGPIWCFSPTQPQSASALQRTLPQSGQRSRTRPPKSTRLPEPQAIIFLAPVVHGALQAPFDRGGDDVGRGSQGSPLRRALRDGGDLRRRLSPTPRPTSRAGSTRGCWWAFRSRSGRTRKVAA